MSTTTLDKQIVVKGKYLFLKVFQQMKRNDEISPFFNMQWIDQSRYWASMDHNKRDNQTLCASWGENTPPPTIFPKRSIQIKLLRPATNLQEMKSTENMWTALWVCEQPNPDCEKLDRSNAPSS